MTGTQFCGVDVPIGGGLSLFIDGNSKITRDNGSFDEPRPNALSLPHVQSCPGATATCAGSCYVHGLRRAQPELWQKYRKNFEVLQKLFEGSSLHDPSEFEQESWRTLGDWIGSNCPGGFRWHVSGDFVNAMHLAWIAEISANSQAPCWLYTRSFEALRQWREYAGIFPSNLVVNLSADRDNYDEALAVHVETGCRICYLVDASGHVPEDLPRGSVLFPDYSLRGRLLDAPGVGWWLGLKPWERRSVCPADFFGQSETRRCGPCKKCL